MPTQDSYGPLSVADNNTYATGFRKDPVSGVLTTYKIPVPFLYGGKWTVGVGVPTTAGVGPGDQYLNVSNGDTYSWDATNLTWGTPTGTLINGSYQFPIWIAGQPLAGEKLYSFLAPSAFIFQAGMTDSLASSDVAATAATVFNLTQNGNSFATITFAAGSKTGTVVCSEITSFLADDLFEVIAPTPADATLSNIRMSLVATRPSGAALSDIISSGEAANSATAAANSATAAANSATAASTSAGAAASSATASSNSATAASTAQGAASTSETNAASSASAASTSAGAAASSASAAAGSASSAAGSATSAATANTNAQAALSTMQAELLYMPGRNRIVNGDCSVAQHPTLALAGTAGTTVIGYGGPDRYLLANGAGGTVTQDQGTFVYNGVNRFAVRQTATVTMTDDGGTNAWGGINQRVEGFNSWHLKGQPITISFIFQASVTGTYSVALRDSTGSVSFVSSFTAVANTPQFVSFTTPALPLAAVVPFSNTLGMTLSIGALNAGSLICPSASLNTWAAGNYITAPGATNWGLTTGATIAACDIQLEAGTTATPFERLMTGSVIAQCQRYYQIFPAPLTAGYTGAAQGVFNDFLLPVALRTSPSAAIVGTINYVNAGSYAINAANSFYVRTSVIITATGYGYGYGAASGSLALYAEL